MARKVSWVWVAAGVVVLATIVVLVTGQSLMPMTKCPGSQVYCPGVGCVSGQDKCFPGSTGGPSVVFSKETFTQWPGAGVRARPPVYEVVKESFVNKKCPDGTRTDGPCLLEFPSF